MSRVFRPVKAWTIRYRNGSISPMHVCMTRKEAIDSFCSNAGYPDDPWAYWYNRGVRAVRVTVQEIAK